MCLIGDTDVGQGLGWRSNKKRRGLLLAVNLSILIVSILSMSRKGFLDAYLVLLF